VEKDEDHSYAVKACLLFVIASQLIWFLEQLAAAAAAAASASDINIAIRAGQEEASKLE
jgi:hypothetical protein